MFWVMILGGIAVGHALMLVTDGYYAEAALVLLAWMLMWAVSFRNAMASA